MLNSKASESSFVYIAFLYSFSNLRSHYGLLKAILFFEAKIRILSHDLNNNLPELTTFILVGSVVRKFAYTFANEKIKIMISIYALVRFIDLLR